MEWIHWLLDSFMTRNHCGVWDSWLIALNQSANFLIFLSYMSIPLSLLSFGRAILALDVYNNDKNMRKHIAIIAMFMCFICLCGLTHLMDVLAFSWAPYRLFTLVDILTAAASVPTAIVLPKVVAKLINTGEK